MAPPIPGTRRPVPVRRRSAGDVLIGLLAVVALAALTAGVPFALVTIFGLPIPHSMPSMSVLTHQLDVFAVIKVLMVLVWLAWIQLVFCVIVEIRAAVRNAGMPARVPLAGGTQMMVHRLVTAALLLVTATTVLSPAFAHHTAAPPPRPAAVSASAVPAYIAPGQHAAPTAHDESHRAPIEKIYVVKPPIGRYHESLWEIAQNHLGDGRRYREIFQMNKDRVQPDGSMLTISSLIRPGWVLHMPADAHGPGIEVIAEGHHHAGDHGSDARTVSRDHGHQAQGGGHGEAGSGGLAGGGREGAGRHGGTTAAPAAPAPQHGLTFPDELAAASLLAAGVLAALGRRRREQLWRRAFGARIAAPAAAAASAEVAMRLGAQEPLTWLLDTGLRYLSQSLGQDGRTPPTVVAAHLSAENLDLWVTPADLGAPSPWTAVGDGQVWRLPAAALHRLDPEQVAGALAPFPGLVSLGTDSGGRVLVDLEAAHGLICLSGPEDTVTSALSAMVVELATNRWSDRMSITLVGFGEDLTLLAPDRITAVRTLAEALPAPGGAGRRGRRRHGHGRHRLRADRPGPRRRPADLGPALPHHGHSAVAPGAAAAAGPGRHPARRRGRLRRRRGCARCRVDLGDQRSGPAHRQSARVRRPGSDAAAEPARRAGRAVRRRRAAARRAPRPRARQLRARRPARARRLDARRDHRPRPRLRAGARASSSPTASAWSPSWSSTWPCTPRACTPTSWPAPSGRAA